MVGPAAFAAGLAFFPEARMVDLTMERAFFEKILGIKGNKPFSLIDLNAYTDWLEETGDPRCDFWRRPALTDSSSFDAAACSGVPIRLGLADAKLGAFVVCRRGSPALTAQVGTDVAHCRWPVAYCCRRLYFWNGTNWWLLRLGKGVQREGVHRYVLGKVKNFFECRPGFGYRGTLCKAACCHPCPEDMTLLASRVAIFLGPLAPHLASP